MIEFHLATCDDALARVLQKSAGIVIGADHEPSCSD
jgi:hypothetical protein